MSSSKNFYNPQAILDFYDHLGSIASQDSSIAMGWHNVETQNLRFYILSQIGKLENCSILDVGCGAGALESFIREVLKVPVQYTGIDLHEKNLNYAKQKHPQGQFILADFLEHDFGDQKFDYVFNSGAISVLVDNNEQYAREMIQKMFNLSNKGIAFNMLTAWLEQKIDEHALYYYEPAEIAKFCYGLTYYVTLRHDYLRNDFTIYAYKQ